MKVRADYGIYPNPNLRHVNCCIGNKSLFFELPDGLMEGQIIDILIEEGKMLNNDEYCYNLSFWSKNV